MARSKFTIPVIIIGIIIIGIIFAMSFSIPIAQITVTPVRVSTVQEILAFQCDSESQYIAMNVNGFDGITSGKDSLTVVCVNKITNELENPPASCTDATCDNVITMDCSGVSSTAEPNCTPSDIIELQFIVDTANEIINEQMQSSTWSG